MEHSWLAALVLFSASASFAEDFPALCPSEQNLPKICESLRNMPSSKIMVFADGSEMPACMLMTISPHEEKRIQDADALRGELYDKYREQYKPPASEFQDVNDMLSNVKGLQRFKQKAPKLAKEIATLEKLLNELDPFPPGTLLANAPLEQDLNKTLQRVDTLLNQVPEGKGLKPSLAEMKLTPAEKNREVGCRTHVNAFFRDPSSEVEIEKAVQQYPRGTHKFIMGHEVGHKIDFCTTKADTKGNPFLILEDQKKLFQERGFKNYPFEKVIDCVRNDVGLFINGDKNNEAMKYNCNQTHAREAFCDHVGILNAAEDLKAAKYPELEKDPSKIYMPKGYEYVFFILDLACRKNGDKDTATHPAPTRRLRDIFLKNPVMAKALGCPVDPKAPYCDLRKGTVNKPAEKTDVVNGKTQSGSKR